MQTPDHSTGFHCKQFDTDLLQQVITVEVDTAVRRVCRERGMELEDINQDAWVHKILTHLQRTAMDASSRHILLPSDIDMNIDREIGFLISQHIRKTPSSDVASFVAPLHGLFRLPGRAGELWHRLFEKHIE